MATNTKGGTALLYQQAVVHFLRKTVTFADDEVAIQVGIVPAGTLILKPMSGVHVTTAFNSGTKNAVDIGTDANDDLWGTDLALGTATFVPLDEAVGGYVVSEDTIVTATVDLTGTAATAGEAEVVICFVPDFEAP